MPLQLIVGWYGMNLIMPEFNWAPAYPIVISVCVVFIVVVIIVFTKRNGLNKNCNFVTVFLFFYAHVKTTFCSIYST